MVDGRLLTVLASVAHAVGLAAGDDDGGVDDLTDLLVDAQANLDGTGLIWVLTPKARTTGAVDAAEIEEAAGAAGMHATSAAAVGDRWSGIRVSPRKR